MEDTRSHMLLRAAEGAVCDEEYSLHVNTVYSWQLLFTLIDYYLCLSFGCSWHDCWPSLFVSQHCLIARTFDAFNIKHHH